MYLEPVPPVDDAPGGQDGVVGPSPLDARDRGAAGRALQLGGVQLVHHHAAVEYSASVVLVIYLIIFPEINILLLQSAVNTFFTWIVQTQDIDL